MRAPRMRHGRGAGVGVGLCVLSHAGQCVALDWTMIELGCRGTQTARQCVAWGDAAGAPANATCALYPGEATGWCWVDAAHNEWEYCDGACRGADAESAGDIILRDVQQSPAILRAAALMHRTEPDMAGAAKALAKVVTANRQVVEDHWSKGGKGVATQNIRRAVVVSAHATFMLASISKVAMEEHEVAQALLRTSCPLLQDLYGDPDPAQPTSFTSACFGFWADSLRESGDLRGVFDVQKLGEDRKFMAKFERRQEDWSKAMSVLATFGGSRLTERRNGDAFTAAKKRMARASFGFTEEMRLYSLGLIKKASVSDAVAVVRAELDSVERVYDQAVAQAKIKSANGECYVGQDKDQANVAGMADRLVVARTLLQNLPPAPQAMELGTTATSGPDLRFMMALVAGAALFAALLMCRWSLLEPQKAKLKRKTNHSPVTSTAGVHWSERVTVAESEAMEPAVAAQLASGSKASGSKPPRTKQHHQKQQPLIRQASAPAATAASKVKDQAAQTVNAAAMKTSVQKIVQHKPAVLTRARSMDAPGAAKGEVARKLTSRKAVVHVQAQGRKAEAAPVGVSSEQHAVRRRVVEAEIQRRVPQPQVVNSRVSEDLTFTGVSLGRKRQVSQPVSDVSEISDVDGDSAGSDAGSSVSGHGSVYTPMSPRYDYHHPEPQQNMTWAQQLKASVRTPSPVHDVDDAGMDMDMDMEQDEQHLQREFLHSFSSVDVHQHVAKRRLSTVGSVGCSEEYSEDEMVSSPAVVEVSAQPQRRARARSKALRPTVEESTSSDSDDDVTRKRNLQRAALVAAEAAATLAGRAVWDGRLPEGVMWEETGRDGTISARVGTIPAEQQQSRSRVNSWDSSSTCTSTSVSSSAFSLPEASTSPAPEPAMVAAAAPMPMMLTRARSVDAPHPYQPAMVQPLVAPLPMFMAQQAQRTSAESDRVAPEPSVEGSQPESPPAEPSPSSPEKAAAGGELEPLIATWRATGAAAPGSIAASLTGLTVAAAAAEAPAPAPAVPGRARLHSAPVPSLVRQESAGSETSQSSQPELAAQQGQGQGQGQGQLRMVRTIPWRHPVPVPPATSAYWQHAQAQLRAQAHHAMAKQLSEQRLRCRHAIEQQIMFYLSAENISRDSYLRKNMDADGYVKLGLIAGFRRIASLTFDMSVIMEAVLANPSIMELRMGGAEGSKEAQEPVIRATDPHIRALRNELEAESVA